MRSVWSAANRFRCLLCVEEETAKAQGYPNTAAELASVPYDRDALDRIEQETRHEVTAFLRYIEGYCPSVRVHHGLTSSDVTDTTFALQLYAAVIEINRALFQLLSELKRKTQEHALTPMIGRTHGQHAEPVTLGLVFAGSYTELVRAKRRMLTALDEVAVGKLSGAVGTYGAGTMTPEMEAQALKALGLRPEALATQVIPRDRHAALFQSLALLGAAIERLCINLRHLQRSEVAEVFEGVSAGQNGSSAMPHKRNPVSAENLCGLARLLRSYADASVENVALWHERDISHSSVERVIAPDATSIAEYMCSRAAALVRDLEIDAEQMLRTLESSEYASERLMLALVEHGMPRSEAHRTVSQIVYTCRWQCCGPYRGNHHGSFIDSAVQACKVHGVSMAEIKRCFDWRLQLEHVPAIIERALKEE